MSGGTFPETTLGLSVLGCDFAVDCPEAAARDSLRRIYSSVLRDSAPSGEAIRVSVVGSGSGGFRVESSEETIEAAELGTLLWAVGTHIVLLLQRARPDLLFLHGAALARGGRAIVLLAQSGGGKSTTTWGLLHNGFELLSDELAPVDAQGRVRPFPRALHLKRRPPAYALPDDTFEVVGHHVPLETVPSVPPGSSHLPAVLGFLEHRDAEADPEIVPVSTAEATARIYATALNPLAHAGQGVDACLALARACPAYRVVTGDLERSCAALRALFDERLTAATPYDERR